MAGSTQTCSKVMTRENLRHARWTKGRVEVKEKVETAARKHCNNALSK